MAASCIFVKSDNFFYFNNTCINQEVEAHLHIRNVGEIMAEISAAITSESSVFRVEPETVSIEAYTSERISVFFKPIALEVSILIVNFPISSPSSFKIFKIKSKLNINIEFHVFIIKCCYYM